MECLKQILHIVSFVHWNFCMHFNWKNINFTPQHGINLPNKFDLNHLYYLNLIYYFVHVQMFPVDGPIVCINIRYSIPNSNKAYVFILDCCISPKSKLCSSISPFSFSFTISSLEKINLRKSVWTQTHSVSEVCL